MSWGSRDLFTWPKEGRLQDVVVNQRHMVDYQDGEYSGGRAQVCTGATNLATPDVGTHELGGIALLDLKTDCVLHEAPVEESSTASHSVTRNPATYQARGILLTMLTAPNDGEEANSTDLQSYAAQV